MNSSAIGAAVLICAAVPGLAATVPVLGLAQHYAVLGGSTVTNTGETALVGDTLVNLANLGLYPGTSVTGCGPSGADQVTFTDGALHVNDGDAQQAQFDLNKAYTALALLAYPLANDLTGQDLGTYNGAGALAPGVYHFDSTAALTGTLELDAQNTDGAYWVFQIGTTLTTSANSVVNLTNANAIGNNGADIGVFWVIGSSATLGSGSTLEGNILALGSITLDTGAAILNGRALARTGAVTMAGNTISDICPLNNNGPGFSGGLVFADENSLVLVPIGYIPEPPALGTFALGLAVLGAGRRRRLAATGCGRRVSERQQEARVVECAPRRLGPISEGADVRRGLPPTVGHT
jgi:type VI secretion system secreted protein VgrG